VNGINFSFLFFLLFLQCLDENVLSETSGWFIDPLEELAVTLLTLEVETAWVLLGTGGGQYPGICCTGTGNDLDQCRCSMDEFEFARGVGIRTIRWLHT